MTERRLIYRTARNAHTSRTITEFFDSLGNSRTMQLTFQKVPVSAQAPMTANAPPALDDTSSQWQLIDAKIPGVSAFGVNSFSLLPSLQAMGAAIIALPPPANQTPDSATPVANTITYTWTAALNPTSTNAGTMQRSGGVPVTTTNMTLTPDQVTALGQFSSNGPVTGSTSGFPSLYFNSSGALNGVATTTTPAVPPALPVIVPGIPPILSLPVDWSLTSTLPGSTAPQNVEVNFGNIRTGTAVTTTNPATGTTQYAGSNLEVRSASDVTGQAPGSFQKASIDTDGYVVFSYSNGQQLKPYRIPLVSFSDANNLQRITGAVFAGNDTLAGKPVARWAGEGDAGNIIASATEASNVDIADELTKMIVAQRAYSSNGKVITAADQMIQEALGLVH